VPQRPYDAIRYPTYPRIETHPDRLASIAALYGMKPAAVTDCRVLEIGCGDGGNLIPMAYFLPGSRFHGIDLEGTAIAKGGRMAADLRLRNLALVESDFRESAQQGEFDFMIAHGLYSWIPAEVRDALLSVCRERLAPHGVVYISYNTWPGRHARHILREMMLFQIRRVRAPRRRLAEARKLLRSIGTAEARDLAARPEDVLFHDDLAPVNDPVWFRDFAAHAAQHGLQYLGEAGGGPRDVPGREQYADFVRMRAFRQSLLCRAEVALEREVVPAQMKRFLFSAGGDPVDAVTAALRDAWPLPLPYDELLPYDPELADTLLGHWQRGAVDLHVHDFPCEETVTARPCATRLARYEAKQSRFVTSVCHHLVELDDADRELLMELDGRRKRSSPRIEWFARMGLLDG
jgi:SAM-dependent methyltransferase